MPHAGGNAQGNAPVTPKEKCELNIEQRTLLFRVPFSVGTGMLGAGRRQDASPRRSLGYVTPIRVERGAVAPGRPRIPLWTDLMRRVPRRNVTDLPLEKVKNTPTTLHPGCLQPASSGIITTESYQATHVNHSGTG